MSARPTLILPSGPNGISLFKDSDGTVTAFSSDAHAGQFVDLVLPGQMVRIHTHDLPKMREREKQAAARFAVEDRTGAALEDQHIVIGSGTDNRLAVIDAAALRAALSSLEAQSLQIGDIYADFDWIAPQEGPLVFEDRIVFTGPEGYTIDPSWADDDLADVTPSAWDALTLNTAALSLRQGAFSRRSGLKLPIASLSKIAALLVLSGLSWLSLQWAQSNAMRAQADDLKSQTAALYMQATGKAAPANPALAVTRAVKTGPVAGSDFIPLIASLNAALSQTNNIAVQTMSFENNKSQLKLRLIYPSFESAGQLETAARQNGGVFRAGGVREQNGILIGDATFEMGGKS